MPGILSTLSGPSGLSQIDNDLQQLTKAVNRLTEQTALAIVVPIIQGGTGATTAAGARTNLGLGSAAQATASNYPTDTNVASVLLPVTIGNIAAFADTNGTIENGGTALLEVTGTWTPALQFGGLSTGITYASQAGTYTKVGREIICRFYIVLTSAGSATGVATIDGLPFASNADSTNTGSGGIVASYANMAALTGLPTLLVGPASSLLSLIEPGAAAATAMTNSNFTGTSSIAGTAIYFV